MQGKTAGMLRLCDWCWLLWPVLLLVHTAAEEQPDSDRANALYSTEVQVTQSLCPDESAITFRYETAEFFQTSRKTIRNQDDFRTPDVLKFLQDLDEHGCRAACVAQEGCVVFEFQGSYINANRVFSQVPNPGYPDFRSSCSLFSSSVFEDPAKVAARPFGAGRGEVLNIPSAVTVAGVKCYYPPSVCYAADVKQLTVNELQGEGMYQASDQMRLSVASTRIQVGPARNNIDIECANLCALGPTSEGDVEGGYVGVCSGFAIEEDLCTLLYSVDDKSTGSNVVPFRTLSGRGTDGVLVYGIADCFVYQEVGKQHRVLRRRSA